MPRKLPFAELQISHFVKDVFRAAMHSQVELGDRHPARVKPHYERDPDEHEFYMLKVGNALAALLTCCEHLQNIPLFLSNYHETPSMKHAGINRKRHIVFHIESYIIRVQGLFDRVLKLIDAIFHLLNDPKNCRSHIILKNLKVKHHATVLSAVKKLEKLLERYAEQRNEVIHAGSFQEDRLRILEMYYIVEDAERIEGKPPSFDYADLKSGMTREIVTDKKKEFKAFNVELAACLIEVFAVLAPCYTKEEHALRLRLGKH